MIIDCVSDLHGHYPKLEGGDLLIVAGDLTARDTFLEYMKWHEWVCKQNYKKVIWIAGNHDNLVESKDFNPLPEWVMDEKMNDFDSVEYLCDSGTEFEGLKIWGSPWTAYFDGMNPHCTAFTINAGCDTDQWLAEKWALIPDDTDILITHSPMIGFGDKIIDRNLILTSTPPQIAYKNVGSYSLKNRIWQMENPPRLIVTGHIHEGYGIYKEKWYEFSESEFDQIIVNASHVNERYQPVNKPIRIEL